MERPSSIRNAIWPSSMLSTVPSSRLTSSNSAEGAVSCTGRLQKMTVPARGEPRPPADGAGRRFRKYIPGTVLELDLEPVTRSIYAHHSRVLALGYAGLLRASAVKQYIAGTVLCCPHAIGPGEIGPCVSTSTSVRCQRRLNIPHCAALEVFSVPNSLRRCGRL